jgi:hypothetical protein
VSLAGGIEKGKFDANVQLDNSARVEYSGRSLRQRLRVLMAFEVPHEQYKKYNHRNHTNTEAVAGSIRTAS